MPPRVVAHMRATCAIWIRVNGAPSPGSVSAFRYCSSSHPPRSLLFILDGPAGDQTVGRTDVDALGATDNFGEHPQLLVGVIGFRGALSSQIERHAHCRREAE